MTEYTTSTVPVPGPGPTAEISFQVAIDCADPHAQARFWAAALGYELETYEGLIRDLMGKGWVGEDEVTTIDGVLHWRTIAAIRRAGAGQAEARTNGGRLLFQAVPEPKTVKDRIHLDLHVGPDHRAAEVERLTGLGAKVLYDHDEKDGRWTTMADPEGNEFCIG